MKLKAQKGKGKKIHILVDGEYDFTTSTDFWDMQGIFGETEVTLDEYETLKYEAEFYWGREYAYDILSRRDHSRYELVRKVTRRVEESTASAIADRMEELGLINDELYAEKYIRELSNLKHFGERRIWQELYKRGIPRGIIDTAIQNADLDVEAGIDALIERRYANQLGDERGRRRAFNALVRRGYDFDDINRAIEKFRKQEETDCDLE